MKIIKADRTKINISDCQSHILVLNKFEIIPKDIINTYKYMNDIYCAKLN